MVGDPFGSFLIQLLTFGLELRRKHHRLVYTWLKQRAVDNYSMFLIAKLFFWWKLPFIVAISVLEWLYLGGIFCSPSLVCFRLSIWPKFQANPSIWMNTMTFLAVLLFRSKSFSPLVTIILGKYSINFKSKYVTSWFYGKTSGKLIYNILWCFLIIGHSPRVTWSPSKPQTTNLPSNYIRALRSHPSQTSIPLFCWGHLPAILLSVFLMIWRSVIH